MFTIGGLSRRTGVKVTTIRYYEQMGLVAAPPRTPGNQRRYARTDLERLMFVRHARELGLSIDAIKELIELSGHPERPCTDADRIVREQLSAVRQRMSQLRRLERELARIASECEGATVRDCYVIRALADRAS
jgi:DNA-binding transcriptional MerR regulator